MRLAILSESPADEAALEVWIAGLLRTPIERVQANLRARGWPSVVQILPAVIRHLHFNTPAQALVVVVDADDSVVHTEEHDRPGYFHPHCRMCRVRAVFRQTTKNLPPAHGRSGVLRGVGVAVPAIEAWYLCGRDPTVTELAWRDGQATDRQPYSRAELKWRVYGTDRPSLPLETSRAVEEAKRQQSDTRRLESDFPGFAALARDVRSWVKSAP